LILAAYELYTKCLLRNHVTNKMEVNLDMLGSCMEDGI
jgi:hypothetical protein